MTAPLVIKSEYAIIDVMKGRHKLEKHLLKRGPVRVMIEATLTCPYGSDDGTSIEFNANVHKIEVIA